MQNRLSTLALTTMLLGVTIAHADETKTDLPETYQHHNRIVVFNPIHQAYERIKPDAMYVGIEGWLTSAVIYGKDSYYHLVPQDLIGEAELRMGYNFFFRGKDHLTPLLGVGVFKDWLKVEHRKDHGFKKSFLPAVFYGTFGFLYDHEFNSIFNLGVNVKGMIGKPSVNKHWGSAVVGGELAIPITFRFGHHRHWDVRLEPFDIYLHGQKVARNYLGIRSTVGYRF